MRVLVFAAALYLLTPGHPDILFSGVPLGQAGAALLILLLVVWGWTRDVDVPVSPSLIRALGIAIAVKLAIALVVPHSGWLAAYYANDQLTPPARRSLHFHVPGATRIDKQLSFVDTEFPVHFYNEQGFNFGLRREATEPFSVLWRGHVDADEPLRIAYDARGVIAVAVDGESITGQPVTVTPGRHVIDIRYRKARAIEGAVHVHPLGADEQPRPWAIGEISQTEVPKSQRTIARSLAPVAWAAHAVVLIVFVLGAWPVVGAKWRHIRTLPLLESAHRCVMPVIILGLTAQGLWKTRHLVGHVWSLTGGDDWMGFEMHARDALLNGWMMRYAVLARDAALQVYPGYSYFLAAVHWLTGESLAGAILGNFVMLALATVLVHAIAMRFTSTLGALVAVAWLLLLEQLDFVRYYTVTLLSENLYFALVALTVFALIRLCGRGSIAWAVSAGLAGGAAAITRPTMMLFLPIAVVVTALALFISRRSLRALAIPLVVVACWMAAVAPITYRNFIVSGEPVMITEGQALTFINYNLPTNDEEINRKYLQEFRDSNLSAARILLWILWDYPAETLRNLGIKAGFALGMVHWMGSSGTPHPELVLTSATYLIALLLVRSARTLPAFLVHGFIFTHLTTLFLSMPSNYGYRMVLPMYVLMVIFAGALVAQFIERSTRRRAAAVTRA